MSLEKDFGNIRMIDGFSARDPGAKSSLGLSKGSATIDKEPAAMCFAVVILLLSVPTALTAGPADAARGAKILDERQCLHCHDFARHVGRSLAGPLAKLRKSQLKPAQLVGAMWSHLPTMSAAAGTGAPTLQPWSEQDAADLLAWFAAAGYFEPAGDSKRGESLFTSQGCLNCHPLSAPATGKPATGDSIPVDRWKSLHDPIALLHSVWRHAPSMKASLDSKTMKWPALTVPEFSDVLAFVYSRAPANGSGINLTLGDAEKGRAIFSMKGCSSCHAKMPASREAGLLHSFTELTAIFWNHAPMMTSLPASLNREEIADVVAFLWVSRYFEDSGNVVRGRATFQRKRCNSCHNEARAVAKNSAVALLAAAWKHAPAAVDQARAKAIPWPKFESGEMGDLIAYLSSLIR